MSDNRFVEVQSVTAEDERREKEGWTLVRDRATGRFITICANSREGALWVIRALNAADRTEDRLSEDAA